MLEDLEKAIQRNDEKSFNRYLAELEKLLRDDKTLGERLTASSALCYAAWVESVPMMDALIEKGVGEAGDQLNEFAVKFHAVPIVNLHLYIAIYVGGGAGTHLKAISASIQRLHSS